MKIQSKYKNLLTFLPLLTALFLAFLLNNYRVQVILMKGELLGSISEFSLAMVLITAIINYASRLLNKLKLKNEILQKLNLLYLKHRKYFTNIHILFAAFLLPFSTLHMLSLSFAGNFFLFLGYSLILVNSLTGIILKISGKRLKYNSYLLHSQWINVFILIFSLLIGHSLVEEMYEFD